MIIMRVIYYFIRSLFSCLRAAGLIGPNGVT